MNESITNQTSVSDEQEAVKVLFGAYRRLRDLGWRNARQAPLDTPLLLIEAGSSGIHSGERDEFGFWVFEGGDIHPSFPLLFKIKELTK